MSSANHPGYDPDRHDNQIVAVFEHRSAADRAREALLGAGIPADAIEVLEADAGGGDLPGTGIVGAIRNLFAPAQDYDDFGHALGQGHAMLVVTPIGGIDRQRAIEVLEASEPLDFEAKRAEWRQSGDPLSMNRAAVTRADLAGKEPPGRDEVMLDMTGQPMRVRSMPPDEMAATAVFSEQNPALHLQTEANGPRPAGPAAAAPEAESPQQTTYTHGVPPQVASGMSPEQSVQHQQPARAESVGLVEERLRIGRREQPPGAVRVRSYLAERDPASQRVRLEEERIGAPDRPVGAQAADPEKPPRDPGPRP